jgi:hypothetical protein
MFRLIVITVITLGLLKWPAGLGSFIYAQTKVIVARPVLTLR